MNFKPRKAKFALVACLIALLAIGAVSIAIVWAASDRKKPDYQGFDLSRPWFDGKEWAWFLDMMDQPSIKPQETGSFQRFPRDSVPRRGVEPVIDAAAIKDGRLLRDLIPPNPTQATPASLAQGRVLYETYCGVCHGNKGEAGTPVTKKGMPAPPIGAMLGFLSEAHLYNKIRYGGPIMPSYGIQTSQQDRWDMVNYMKSADFGKGGSQ
ncbi:MAG: cytochrome c [SAR324 cluster bacterium]|nr:cytochrome c [SAR324 cluster bacterium]